MDSPSPPESSPPSARSVGHALGNLFAVIVGQVEYLIHREPGPHDDADERECLEAIHQAALSGRDRLRDLQHLFDGPTTAPIAAAFEPPTPILASRGGAGASRGAWVLVVEDDPDVRAAVAGTLTRAGYEVIAVGDGPEALEAARAQRFDCVVVDQGLPGLSGLGVTRVLKDQAPDLFVLMLTGDEAYCDAREVQAAGVDRLMGKPFDRDELLGVLGAAR